jgi:hypothetical protein
MQLAETFQESPLSLQAAKIYLKVIGTQRSREFDELTLAPTRLKTVYHEKDGVNRTG